jgi:CHAD domain-containing protein
MAKRSRENGGELLRAVLSTQRNELAENEEGTRLGRDPECLHRMRVATRRARSAVRTANGALEDEQSEGLRSELAWLGGVLGAVRDLDVFTGRLESESETLEPVEQKALKPVFSALTAERRKARAALTRALNGKRYRQLLDELSRAAEAPASQNGDIDFARRAQKEFARLAKSMQGVKGELTDDEIHRVRILGKRARYAAELATLRPSKASAEFVKRAKAFQDVTGEHQDAVVAESKLRELASSADAPGSLALGRLIEREGERRKSARSQLPDAWKKLERAGARAWS